MAHRRNVAIPQGDIWPNGLQLDAPDSAVQSTAHIQGTFFKSSPGIPSIRIGKHRIQKTYHGLGHHFTPLRFAEDFGTKGLPTLVSEKEASYGDVADLPGSGRLDDEGKTTAPEDRFYLAEHGDMPTGTESVQERHNPTLDLDGVRTEAGRITRGFLRNPVDFLSGEYKKTPVKAIVMATGIVLAVNLLAGNVEREYKRRKRRSGAVGAAGGAAAAGTAGAAGDAGAGAGNVAGELGEGIGDAIKAVTDTVEDAGKAIADAVT